MTDRPVLFNGVNVCRIFDGRKTQTRRIVRPRNVGHTVLAPDWQTSPRTFADGRADGCGQYLHVPYQSTNDKVYRPEHSPYHDVVLRVGAPWEPGDTLWVRETWRLVGGDSPENERDGLRSGIYQRADVVYRADRPEEGKEWGWRPSIYMPRWACRLRLRVTAVRAERLQDISHDDIRAEGIECHSCPVYGLMCEGPCLKLHEAWATGWDMINGKRGPWASNPWVWALTFERLP